MISEGTKKVGDEEEDITLEEGLALLPADLSKLLATFLLKKCSVCGNDGIECDQCRRVRECDPKCNPPIACCRCKSGLHGCSFCYEPWKCRICDGELCDGCFLDTCCDICKICLEGCNPYGSPDKCSSCSQVNCNNCSVTCQAIHCDNVCCRECLRDITCCICDEVSGLGLCKDCTAPVHLGGNIVQNCFVCGNNYCAGCEDLDVDWCDRSGAGRFCCHDCRGSSLPQLKCPQHETSCFGCQCVLCENPICHDCGGCAQCGRNVCWKESCRKKCEHCGKLLCDGCGPVCANHSSMEDDDEEEEEEEAEMMSLDTAFSPNSNDANKKRKNSCPPNEGKYKKAKK